MIKYYRELQARVNDSGPHSLTADEMGNLHRLEMVAPEMLDRLISASLALINPKNEYQETVLQAIIDTIAKARGTAHD